MTDNEIHKAVLEHMRSHNITKADVARQLGVSHQAVSGVLTGKSGKVPSSLRNILTAVGLQLVVAPKIGEKKKLEALPNLPPGTFARPSVLLFAAPTLQLAQ